MGVRVRGKATARPDQTGDPAFQRNGVVALRTGNPRRHPERMQMACQSQLFFASVWHGQPSPPEKHQFCGEKCHFQQYASAPRGSFRMRQRSVGGGGARRILHRAPQNAARDAVPWPRRRRDSAGVSDCRYDPRWRPCLPLITSPPRS